MESIIAEYGVQVLGIILVGLGSLVTKVVVKYVDNKWAQGVLQRSYAEVKAASMEVMQTYVDGIKRAKADGKLTEEEKRDAKRMALKIAKANIGKKGLRRLARALDVEGTVDGWLDNKVESSVREVKTSNPS